MFTPGTLGKGQQQMHPDLESRPDARANMHRRVTMYRALMRKPSLMERDPGLTTTCTVHMCECSTDAPWQVLRTRWDLSAWKIPGVIQCPGGPPEVNWFSARPKIQMQ